MPNNHQTLNINNRTLNNNNNQITFNNQSYNNTQTLYPISSSRFLEIPTFTKRNRHLSIDYVPELLNEQNLKQIKFENKDIRSTMNLNLQEEHIE